MILTSLETRHYKQFLTFFSRHGHSIYQNVSNISLKDALVYEGTQVIDSQAKGDVNIIAVLNGNKVVGTVACGERKWDTEHFGFKTGKISHLLTIENGSQKSLDVQKALLRSAFNELRKLRVRCIIARIPFNQKSTIHTLEESGFLLMDAVLTFFAETANCQSVGKEPQVEVRPYRNSEIRKLMKITNNAFVSSHFFADQRFPRKKSNELYEKWVENACGGSADEVLVAHFNETPAGFVILKKDKSASDFLKTNIGIIDLIAVSKEFQHQGIGHALMISSLKWFCNNQIFLARVGTQLNNIGGIKLDLKTGFQYASSELTFHKWMKPEPKLKL